ncbi:MAG: RES family NAD+ phosphorylase [Sporichthyaceae bacterium]
MTVLYRVLPFLDDASVGTPGHPLHVPASTGSNRIDNPDLYDTLYLGDDPRCAVAEAFGSFPRWSAGLFRGKPSLPGSVAALAAYHLEEAAAVCDLDDAERLVHLGLRPSRVVTRDRAVTQGWARTLHADGRFAGVRWWSYYNPEWGSIGLWDVGALTLDGVEPLGLKHPHVVAAAEHLCRPLG